MDASKRTTQDRQPKNADQNVNDAVVHEQVHPHQKEEVTTAVDKDVHQDHHHTTVQPVEAQETLPEQHHQNVAPVTHKTVEHGNKQDTKNALDREAAKFKNTSTRQETTQSQSTAAPVQTGERVHHHVHENIQPVVEKETVQPHVVHTTVPVHETHQAETINHGTSVLPTKTLGELERTEGGGGGGVGVNSTGQNHGVESDLRQRDHHAGQTASGAGSGLGTAGGAAAATATTGAAAHEQRQSGARGTDARGVNGRGVGQAGLDEHRTRQQEPRLGSSTAATGGAAAGAGAGPGAGAAGTGTAGAAQTAAQTAHAKPHDTSTAGHSHARDAGAETSGTKKPSMGAKLNPFKDADGDGHKGFMS